MNPIVAFVAFIFGSRLFSLFAFYPIAAAIYLPYDSSLTHLPLLLGCYSFCQSFFQLVWAALSQKIGRLRMVRLGLSLFFIGSVLATFAPNLELLILARSLQGASAIGATTQALLADHITDLKELQISYYQIGIAIMLSFALSFLATPLFEPAWLFFVTTGTLALISIALSFVIQAFRQKVEPLNQKSSWVWAWPSTDILALLVVNFALHFLQAAAIGSYQIIARPGTYELGALFLIGLLFALKPLKERRLSLSFSLSQKGALLALIVMAVWILSGRLSQETLLAIYCGLTFNLLLLLEASLPAQLRLSASEHYPLWIGFYTTLQSLGIALGSLSLYAIDRPWALWLLLGLPMVVLVLGLTPLRHAALAQPDS